MLLGRLRSDESGQGATEYGLLLAAIAVCVVAVAALYSTRVQSLFISIGSYIDGAFV